MHRLYTSKVHVHMHRLYTSKVHVHSFHAYLSGLNRLAHHMSSRCPVSIFEQPHESQSNSLLPRSRHMQTGECAA